MILTYLLASAAATLLTTGLMAAGFYLGTRLVK
jgi:hypothetical protein